MTRHTVTVDEIDACLAEESWNDIAFSSGKGSDKRLAVSNKGELRVTDHGRVTYSGTAVAFAVRAYNEGK